GIPTGSNPVTATLYHLETWTTETVSTVGIPLDHHELLRLPNGDFMLLSYVPLAGVDLTGFQNYGPNSTIADCAIQEVDPQGNLVWDWRARDHTDPVRASTAPTQFLDPLDGYHCNTHNV